jgi:hypothetical protein
MGETDKPQILRVKSIASGRSLDPRIHGECISLVADVDDEDAHFMIPQESWEKIVRNADWFREPRAPEEKTYAQDLEKTLKAHRVLARKCAQCGGELAYPGAIYCGAGCTARSEAHEPLGFKDTEPR